MIIDLHVHSRFSKRPSTWLLQKIGCPESFTEPLRIYDLARERGMSWVTITDHNTIEGALEIAGLPGTFLSEEVTTYFPGDGCKIHVLVYNITESQHEDIQKAREDVFSLCRYLRANRIAHAVAHPLLSVNGRLKVEHFEQMLLLFPMFELNQDQDAGVNAVIRAVLKRIGPGEIAALARKHNIEPYGKRPWRKGLIAGSDDHSSQTIAHASTRVAGAKNPADFFRGVHQGLAGLSLRRSTPQLMAHNIYSIVYQFYRNELGLKRYAQADDLLRFLDRCLLSETPPAAGLLSRLYCAWNANMPKRQTARPDAPLGEMIQHEAKRIIRDDPALSSLLANGAQDGVALEKNTFAFVSEVSDRAVRHLASHALNRFEQANVFDLFQSVGSTGAIFMFLAPYFVSYSQFASQRRFARETLARFRGKKAQGPRPRVKVAYFSDAANGGTPSPDCARNVAAMHGPGAEFVRVLCTPRPRAEAHTKTFRPVAVHRLNNSGELLHQPPLLALMDYCYREGFTHVHCETPGIVGMTALAIARNLGLPMTGSWHDPRQTASAPIGEAAEAGGMLERYLMWYYGQADRLCAATPGEADDLRRKGFVPERICLVQEPAEALACAP